MNKKDRKQQDKEWEENYYPEMKNSPINKPGFLDPKLKDEIIPADEILAEVINFDLQVIRKNPDVVRVLTFGEALIAMEKYSEQFRKK